MNIVKQFRKVSEFSNFSWKEACSDPNGQSSLMPIAGAFLIFIGGVMSIYAGIAKPYILSQYVMLASLGSAILVGKKIINGKTPLEEVVVPDEEAK